MNKLRENLSINLISKILKSKGVPYYNKHQWEDEIMNVYLKCLESENHYTEDYKVSTFVHLKIDEINMKRYRGLKGAAKKEAEHVDADEALALGSESSIESRILISQLKKYMCTELLYLISNPASDGYVMKSGTGIAAAKDNPYMTVTRIAKLLGLSKATVGSRIKKNREELKELMG